MKGIFFLLTMTLGLSLVDAQESKKASWWESFSQATSVAADKAWEGTKEKTTQTLEYTRSQRDAAAKATSDAASKAWTAAIDKTAETWEATKEKSAQTLEYTWSQRDAAAKATSDAAAKTWANVGEFYVEHETVINTAAVAAVVVGAVIISETYFGNDAQIPRDAAPYSSLSDHPTVGSGKFFTSTQKESILSENMARNGGVLRSDLSGSILATPGVYTKGYTPSANEAQIDHIFPRSLGGTNSFGNAQVLSREENLIKGATPP